MGFNSGFKGLTRETSLIYCERLWSVTMEQILVHISHVSQARVCPSFAFVFISIAVQQKIMIQLYLFSGVYPSVASDHSYYLRIVIVRDINRPKWLACIQNAGNEKFRTNIEIARMNGNKFFCTCVI